MEIFDDKEVREEEVKEEKGGGKKLNIKPSFKKPSFPAVSNKVLIAVGGSGLAILLALALFKGGGPTVVTSPDVEVVDKVMREQLKLQKEMQKQLIKEIQEIKEEIRKQKQSPTPPPSSEGADESVAGKGEKGMDVFELLKRRDRKRKEEKEEESSMEIIKLREELRRLQEEIEGNKGRKRGRGRETEPIRIQIKEREVNLIKGSKLAKEEESKKKKVFIPAGSVMKGRIVSAFFAPVGDAQKFPAVLIELKGDTVTPNHFRFPLEGCRVVAKAEGDWVLERAKLETYKLACVLPNGKVVETKFSGKVVSGIDGGEGVKGRFLNASGKQLRTYFGTTFLGTLFESLAQAQVDTQTAVEGGAVFQSQVIKNEGEYAFYSAMADTWKQFSQFYLNQAKKALPVVLVDGDIPIYIEVIDGFSLGVDVDEVAGLYR